MTTPLPEPGHASPVAHAAISRRFIAQAKEELEGGDRIQASEKVWGAAAHAVKAIAEQRGWIHQHHAHINSIAGHLSREFELPELRDSFRIADAMRKNFYENGLNGDDIMQAIDRIEGFVEQMESIRRSPPRPFVITDADDRRRIRQLTGRQVEIGDQSPEGFALNGHPGTEDAG